MEPSALDIQVANEQRLRNITNIVGEWLVHMNYAGVKFVHHPDEKHIGVEIIPMPKSLVIR